VQLPCIINCKTVVVFREGFSGNGEITLLWYKFVGAQFVACSCEDKIEERKSKRSVKQVETNFLL